MGQRKVGDIVNIEIDPQTQAIVDTVEKIICSQKIFSSFENIKELNKVRIVTKTYSHIIKMLLQRFLNFFQINL